MIFDANETADNKKVTLTDLKEAIARLTGFLSIRDYFFRFSEDFMVI